MDSLTRANLEFARTHPGESGARQPVHTVYGGAHLFRSDSCGRLGALALRALAEYAPDPATLALAVGLDGKLADTVYARVSEKLRREPVEDYRLDFEDGYGHRPDAEEDATAESAAREVAKGLAEGTLPPFLGIRLKPLNEESNARSLRTLEIFLGAIGKLPETFTVTLPKITVAEQVSALAEALDRLGGARMELMVETPQSVFSLLELIGAAKGRCTGVHFGAYDYTASLGITAAHQSLLHPACDFARSTMQALAAGTGVALSDGAMNILPLPVHRSESAAPWQQAENRAAVHRGWKLHFEQIRRSLGNGFYQGWDLHPAQLVARYAAVYSFFLEGLEAASERLRHFLARAAQATQLGGVFDDAATGQGLLNYFVRAINCGAIREAEALERTGLDAADLRSASFAKILNRRRQTA